MVFLHQFLPKGKKVTDPFGDRFRIEGGATFELPADQMSWLREIVDYEILPLLAEYWFDNEDRLSAASSVLEECN